MTQPTPHDDPNVEPGRFSIRPVLIFGAGVLVALAVVYGITALILGVGERAEPDMRSVAEPWAMEDPERSLEVWPPPLQPDPEFDYEVLRARQLGRLETYGWVDREREIVHIPIERAIELVLEQEAIARDDVEVSREGGP
jgi:hypothetical protein